MTASTYRALTHEEGVAAQLHAANKKLDFIRGLHASYLYENSEIRERRCLSCDVSYPCSTTKALDTPA